MTKQKKDWKTIVVDLETKLVEVFGKKLPAMPGKAKEIIVKVGPYLVVMMLVFAIPAMLALIGVGIAATPLAFVGGIRGGLGYLVTMIFGLIMIVMEVMAVPGLFKRQMKAWKLMFYISLINAVSALLSFNLSGLIIGTGISWYVLFQIRSYYK